MTRTFSAALRQIWQEIPDQRAIILLSPEQGVEEHNAEVISYRRLISGAAGYARALAGAGIQPGEVVILILQHGMDLVYAFWGAILHGAIPSIMPFLTEKLSPEHYRRSLVSLFEITAPAAVITYPEFLSELQVAAQGASSIRAVLNTNDIGLLEDRVKLFDGLRGLERKPEDIVLLQHSSGTTGLQKGVALSHQAVFHQIESYAQAIDLRPDDVVVSWLPLYHDMGLIAGFIMPVLSRVPLVLMSPFDWVRAPYKLLQAVSQHRGTLSWLPNFAYNFCAQKIRNRYLKDIDLSSWRAVINCSEPMYWHSHQMFLQRFQPYGLRPEALATCYAMAENVFAVTQGGIHQPVRTDCISQQAFTNEHAARPSSDGEAEIKMLSAGPPIENTHVRILHPETRQELPERQVGEIALQSNCMLTGYYNRADLTAKAFHDGWYLTGDLGYIADGELYITGRKKDLIIVGGKNIYPQDLESLASEVEGVHPGRVAALGVANETSGTDDVIIVAEVDVDDAQERQRIADQVRSVVTKGSDVALRYVHLVERGWLIKTSSGKVSRSANREKYLAEREE